MKKLIAILSLSTVACLDWQKPDSNQYHLYISPEFTADQSEMIVQAATEWQVGMGNYIRFDGAGIENGENTINIYPTTMKELDPNGGRLGETWYGPKEKIEISTDSNDFYQTALHEMGHAIGANHIEAGNIMCADSGCASEHVQCGDVKEVCSHWGNNFQCDWAQMPVCTQTVAAK